LKSPAKWFEFLQVDHVMTSKDTLWNDRAKAGDFFLKFLNDAIKFSLKAQTSGSTGAPL
jgi:hypothetical protein